MKVAVGIGPVNEDWEGAAAFLQEAERIGVGYAWSAETWGHDAATPVAYMAAKTSRIMLGTGIIQAAARTPANIAMISLALASMSHDRFILGLGASGPQVVEGWHGVPFRGAVQRLRETAEIVRIVTRGERLTYDGKIYNLPRPGGEGKALKTSAQPRNVPVYMATLSPKSLEMTGEVADGWIGTSFIPEHADIFFEHIAKGAARAGRTLSDLNLQANAGVIEFSDDVERLIPARKPGLAFSLGAMGSRQHNSTTTPTSAPATPMKPSPSKTSGSKASVLRPPPSSPTRWCCSRTSSAPKPWSATAFAPTKLLASIPSPSPPPAIHSPSASKTSRASSKW